MQTSLRRKPLLQRAARAPPEPLRVAQAQACTTVVVCRPGKARGRPFAQGGDHRQYQARSGTVPPPPSSAAEKTAASVLQRGFESGEEVAPLTAAERRQPVDGRLTRLIQLERGQLLARGLEGEEVPVALASTFHLALTTVKKVLKRGRGELEEAPAEDAQPPRKRAGRPRIVSEEAAEAAAAVGRKDNRFFNEAAAGELQRRGVKLSTRSVQRYMKELGARKRPAIEYSELPLNVRRLVTPMRVT